MPAGVTSISTPRSSSLLVAPRRASGASSACAGLPERRRGVRAGALVLGRRRRRAPARALRLDQPQPAAAAGEHVLDQLLEVRAGRGEGLLEGGRDLAVGRRISFASSASAASRSSRWDSRSLDVLLRLLVLALGQRVDRAELLAAADQPLDPRLDPRPLLVLEPLRAPARGSSSSLRDDPLPLRLGLLAAVAQVRRRGPRPR